MPDDVLIIDDSDRYGRLRLISWWRQEKLSAAKILVVGAGALGNEVLKNLALLGAGRVFIIDFDRIEATNLTRSILFRAGDAGRSKAERAADAVRALNPDVRVRALDGNVITDLGLGVFAEMDVVIGCLDNREARLWINRQCWRVGRPWVDGAIQEISGVAKVFVPPESACYECAMTEADYRLLNLRYSCPLLRREDLAEGKVPTAPTIASIIAGLETQEALKLLHALPVQAGAALVFNGESNNFYTTRFQRREDCLSHESWPAATPVPFGASSPAAALLKQSGGSSLLLIRDLLVSLSCPACGVRKMILKALQLVSHKEGVCATCGQVMRTEIVHEVAAESPLAAEPLLNLGVAPFDIVQVKSPKGVVFLRLEADRDAVLRWT
ncbi:MAG TPA: ThiF family adenylyltransferase [Planctomycetota bacterium]|nr:ThiF family adenylyltransferase [Planctomycetota bacterium]